MWGVRVGTVYKRGGASETRKMKIKITVDGKEHNSYAYEKGMCITVGSRTGAEVCVPWAAEESVKIYPVPREDSNWGGYEVTVLDPRGMMLLKIDWMRRPKKEHHSADTEKVMVYSGDQMVIRGHRIRVISDMKA